MKPRALFLGWLAVITLFASAYAIARPPTPTDEPKAEACITAQVTPRYVIRTIDGDTFLMFAIGVPPEERVRVLAVDAPEIRDSLGPAARDFTSRWLADGPFTVQSCRRDTFGRLLAHVTRGTTDTLARDLINAGLGTRR